jgi:hypothetical protein
VYVGGTTSAKNGSHGVIGVQTASATLVDGVDW